MMKKLINSSIAALAASLVILACVGFTPAAQAVGNKSIVGLWNVHYVSTTGGPEVLTYDQWGADGQEIETANIFVGAICQGTYKIAANGTVHLHHVAWTFDSTGAPSGYWDEALTANVASGQTYSGTYTKNFYDTNNNFLFTDAGTLTATRITVNE